MDGRLLQIRVVVHVGLDDLLTPPVRATGPALQPHATQAARPRRQDGATGLREVFTGLRPGFTSLSPVLRPLLRRPPQPAGGAAAPRPPAARTAGRGRHTVRSGGAGSSLCRKNGTVAGRTDGSDRTPGGNCHIIRKKRREILFRTKKSVSLQPVRVRGFKKFLTYF